MLFLRNTTSSQPIDSSSWVLLVTRTGHWGAMLQLPGVLRRAGMKVAVFSHVDAMARASWNLADRIAAPEDHTFVAALKNHLETRSYRWVIFGDEPTFYEIATAAQNNPADAEWISQWFPIAHPESGVDHITSKAAFAEAAAGFNIPTPESVVCHDVDATRAAIDRLGYPVMFKTSIGCAGDGVIKVNHLNEFESAFAKLSDRLPIVVQKFEPGLIGMTEILFDHGKPVCWWPTFKTEVFPEPYGPSCVRTLPNQVQIDKMEPIIHAVGQMTQFHGFCGIDWLYSEAGEFNVLEFNPRPTPGTHFATMTGQDLSMAVRDMLAGRHLPQRPRATASSGKLVYLFPQYVKRTIRHRRWLDLRHYLPFTQLHDVPWDEPGIMAKQVWSIFNLLMRDVRSSLKNRSKRSRSIPPTTVLEHAS